MSRPNEDREAYRCTVAPENSAAALRIGRKQFRVTVLETSRDGFTVRVPNDVLSKLEDGGIYILFCSGEKWQVRKQSHYSDGLETTNIGFSRIEELTRVKVPSTWLPSIANKLHSHSDPAFLIYLMLAFLFACIALPGMGDSLGTAPRIRNGIHAILEAVTDFF